MMWYFIKNTKTNYAWCKGVGLKRIGKVLYLVKDIDSSEIHKRHINQLMLYKGTSNDHGDNIQNSDVNIPESSPSPSPPPSRASSPSPPPPSSSSAASSTILHSPATLETCTVPVLPVLQSGLSSPNRMSSSLAKGRRAELYEYEPRTCSPSGEVESDLQQTNDDGQPAGVNDSEDEFQEAETNPDAQGEPQIDDSAVGPQRLLRKRPRTCFKKYF